MKTRFRIKSTDVIKAVVVSAETGKVLASDYNSGFTTISEVCNNVIRKIPHFGGKLIEVQIMNKTKDEYTIRFIKKQPLILRKYGNNR